MYIAEMAPGPSTRRGRLAPPTPRIWLTAGALLAVACQGGGERPLETSPGLSLDPWGLAEPAAATTPRDHLTHPRQPSFHRLDVYGDRCTTTP